MKIPKNIRPALKAMIRNTYNRLPENDHSPSKHYTLQELQVLFEKQDREFLANFEKLFLHGKNEEVHHPAPPEPRWLNTRQVLQYYPMCKRTLAKFRSQGRIPYTKIDNCCYYLQADLEAFMRKHYRKGSE